MKPINYVKKYYGKLTHKEICEKAGITLFEYRGLVSKLVKADLIVSQNKKPKKTKKQKVNEGKFNNVEGIGKIRARQKMVKYLRRMGGLILTLPSYTCRIEQMLTEDLPNVYKFVGCEADRDIFKEMVNKAMELNLNMDFYNGMLGDIIAKANTDEFSHIVMDYCGTLHKAQDDIRTALTNDIVKVGGTLHITLNRRSAGFGGIVDEMHNINPNVPKGCTKTSNALLTFIKVCGGLRYEIKEVFNYHDTSSMVLVVVKRVK
jgi:hypothetical protein